MDREPYIIGCRELARLGAWNVASCCPGCHAGTCAEDLALCMDVGPVGEAGRIRLDLCCHAAGEVDLGRLAFLTAAEAPADGPPPPG